MEVRMGGQEGGESEKERVRGEVRRGGETKNTRGDKRGGGGGGGQEGEQGGEEEEEEEENWEQGGRSRWWRGGR